MIELLPGIHSTAAALEAERTCMDVVAQNIANTETTHGLDGKPYQRQQVVFESILNAQQSPGASGTLAQQAPMVRVEKDPRPPRMVYNPGHPDANAQGMVAMPNINIHEEMVQMIESSRAFEANLAVAKNSRAMAMQALSIGKH